MKAIKNIFIILSITLILFVTLKFDYNLSKNKNNLISMYEKKGVQLNLIRKIPDGNLELIYTCKENESLTWDNIKRQIRFSSNSETTTCNLTFQKSDVTLVLSPANGNVLLDQEVTSEITGSNYGLLSCTVSNPLLATCSINENILTVTGKNIGSTTVEVKESNLNKTVTYTVNVITSLYNKLLMDNLTTSDLNIDFAFSPFGEYVEDWVTYKTISDNNQKTNGLYYTSNTAYGEDNTRIYYFRGSIENNWVSFGGYLWRIVRTTSEGGVKLIYSGNGENVFIGSSIFNSGIYTKYRTGYTYNASLNSFSGTQTNSQIKTVVDNWYLNNINNEDKNYLSTTAIYCADRSQEITYTKSGYTFTDFPSNYRFTFLNHPNLSNKQKPTYKCPSTNESRYTNNTNTGNGYLTYPVGLLSIDEAMFAGILNELSGEYYNRYSYLTENDGGFSWWTMSPSGINSRNEAVVCYILKSGIENGTVETSKKIRPVISLKSCITTTNGNGTKTNPYIISDSNC